MESTSSNTSQINILEIPSSALQQALDRVDEQIKTAISAPHNPNVN